MKREEISEHEESLGNTIACMHNVVEPFFKFYAEYTQWMKIKERSCKVDVEVEFGTLTYSEFLGCFFPLTFSYLHTAPVKTTLLTPFSPRTQFRHGSLSISRSSLKGFLGLSLVNELAYLSPRCPALF